MSDTATLAERLEKVIRANRTATRRGAAQSRADLEASAREVVQSSSLASLSEGIESASAAQPGPETALPRVLIVERDPLHLQVLARLVENLGYAVDSTGTAAEGLAAFDRQPYAIVMLDCDSTEAQGLETAAAIRRSQDGAAPGDSPRIRRTPIIALTVHAGPEDRQQREAAGIDNYIAKPILRENVESMLSRYAPATPADRPQTALRYLALDRHRLVELEEAAGSRPELLRSWIGMFLNGAPALLGRMQAAQAAGDASALCEAADRLRSHSGQIGALRIQEICGIAAALGASGSLAGVEALLPELSIALDRAAAELYALEDGIGRGHTLAGVPAVRTHASTACASPGSRDLLLAEADPLLARFLSNGLTGAGFTVTHVSGGAAAVEAFRDKAFGVVILNLDVPEVDGYGVLSEIRMRPDAATPVMIVSARHQEQDILRAFELGADDYVTIPFSPLEVVARVRRLVKQGGHVS